MKKKENEQILKPSHKERCIICGKEVGYDFNAPIQERRFYVEGAGQLCEECYYNLYIKKTVDF